MKYGMRGKGRSWRSCFVRQRKRKEKDVDGKVRKLNYLEAGVRGKKRKFRRNEERLAREDIPSAESKDDLH